MGSALALDRVRRKVALSSGRRANGSIEEFRLTQHRGEVLEPEGLPPDRNGSPVVPAPHRR